VNWKWPFAVSVALNLGLVAVLLLQSPSAPPDSAQAGRASASHGHELNRPAPLPASDRANEDEIQRQKGPSSRAGPVESDYYPTFIRRLRAAGLSEDTIATLVVAELRDRRMEDSIALRRKYNRGELTEEDFQKQNREMQKAQEAALEAILGKDGYRQYQIDHDYQLRQLTLAGHFSQETLENYFDLRKRHHDQMQELSDRWTGRDRNDAEYQDQVHALQKSYEQELEKSLGVDAVRRIRAETDGDTQNVRRLMAATKISDDEYVQMSQIFHNYRQEQQRLTAMRRRVEGTSEDLRPQQEAMEQQRKDQLAALLGPQRYAEYEKQMDGTFQQLNQWGKPNGLNHEQVDYVYSMIKHWRAQQQELRKLRSDPQYKREDYNAAMEQLSADTRTTLQRYLGAERYEQLKRSTGQVP
jgi:hypothetical protein